MSYTNIDILPELINKKVLFIDLETTGLVQNKKRELPQEIQYPSYKSNEDYNTSRIVQFGYICFNNFDYDYEVGEEHITSIIIKPDGFVIPMDSIKIHGITNEDAIEKGIGIKKALKKIKKIVKDVDYIIGYNIYFDVNIMMNELYRVGYKSTINKIKDLITNQKILCVGELSAKYRGGNMPRQTYIYKEIFGTELENAHNAVNDILATIKLFCWYYDNRDEFGKINIQNQGKKWDNNEINNLIEEIKIKKTLEEIANFHGRTIGSIRSSIHKLLKNQKITIDDISEEYNIFIHLEQYKY